MPMGWKVEKRFKNPTESFHDKVMADPNSGCWIWTGALNAQGYGVLGVYGKVIRAHRFSWELVNGPIPRGLCALHKCDVRACVNPDHIFLGTMQDNSTDMVQKGRHRPVFISGEDSVSARLNAQQVLAIRNDKRSAEKLSPEYGVCPSTIRAVRRRETWRHI